MRNLKGKVSAIIWLLAALPALFPVQLRPHHHVEAHTAASGSSDAYCSICDAPVLLEALPGFEVPAPVLRHLQTVFAPQLPEISAPCISKASCRAPPLKS